MATGTIYELDVPRDIAQAASDLMFNDYATLDGFAFEMEQAEEGFVVHVARAGRVPEWHSAPIDFEEADVRDVAHAIVAGLSSLRAAQSFAQLEVVADELHHDLIWRNAS